jgi:hypothetical protein
MRALKFLFESENIGMLQTFGNDVVIQVWHRCFSVSRAGLHLCCVALLWSCKVHAQQPAPVADNAASGPASVSCLASGDGYLRARLSGALNVELDWSNEGTECTGAVRPTDGGIRMRFSRPDPAAEPGKGERLVLVFGIAGLREGEARRSVPVNLTVIREGRGEFYSTQGDDKCMLDTVTQEAIVGIPRRSRSYRIVARGYCTEPARAVRGQGAVLLSRFDLAGRVDFDEEYKGNDDILAEVSR